MNKKTKNELRDILSGKSEVGFGATIQTITNYLNKSQRTSTVLKEKKYYKNQETEKLINFISEKNLWVDVAYENYVSEGAEQKVYLKNNQTVLKLNDSIYYTSWFDYFNNLLIHNYFFPDTAYNLIGFTKKENILYAVVEQAFVTITSKTDLDKVEKFMFANDFVKIRNNDYINPNLGIILEDLHDENVLTKNGLLYFIDTVFYITDSFYKD